MDPGRVLGPAWSTAKGGPEGGSGCLCRLHPFLDSVFFLCDILALPLEMSVRLYRDEAKSLCPWEDDAKRTDSPEAWEPLCPGSQSACRVQRYAGSASMKDKLILG